MDSEIFELAREVGWMPIILYFLFKDKLAEVFNLKSSAGTQLDTINSRIDQVERMAVSEDRVREIVKDELKPLSQALREIKEHTSRIDINVTDIRVKVAKIEGREEVLHHE